MKELEEKVNRLEKIVIALCIVVGIIAIFSVGGLFSTKKEVKEEQTSTNTTTSYDVSSFNALTTAEVNKLFEDKNNTYVVYLGRATCSACEAFLPTLKSMQNKYKYVTQYLDITTVDASSDDYTKLVKNLSKEVSITVSGETKTQSMGEFFGYTPMVFIVKKGKLVDGFVGSYSEAKFETFLNNNGIK